MTKRTFLFASMLATVLTFSNVSLVMADPIDLSVSIINPNAGHLGQHRGPVLVPEVDLDGSTLSLITPCDGCEILLLDENGGVVYSTVIPVGTTSLVLPSYLSGEYEIQIIRDNFCFFGFIEL